MMIHYRLMKPQDAPGVFRVDQDCFKHNWTVESYEEDVRNMLSSYVVAEKDGEIIGFGGFWLIIDEAHITNIGVMEEHRYCGIGQQILDEMLAVASHKGCLGMTLEVREDNRSAIKFYEKNGFVKEGVRKNYYGNGVNGFIMWRHGLE
jgi:ribosomal-protein-alanine N-acetyltransferase